MKYDPAVHHRRSIRLPGHEHAQPGAYFVRICTHGRACLFGSVVNDEMLVNEWGRIVASCWTELSRHCPSVDLDAFVVMPNHVHGILALTEPVGAGSPRPHGVDSPERQPEAHFTRGALTRKGAETAPLRPTPTLGQVVAYFKYESTKRINQLRDIGGKALWQRNYYEHIIRSEGSLHEIREYIVTNPQRWVLDSLHPDNAGNS